MKIDTQEVVNLIKNVIRNPLRSLLMKIGGSAARPKYPSDVEKVAVTATFSTIFNLSGHS